MRKLAGFTLLVLTLLSGISSNAQRIKHFQEDYSITNRQAIKKYERGKLAIDVDRNFKGGIALIQEALKDEPDFIEAHLTVAKAMEVLRTRNSAYSSAMIKHYKKVAELAPYEGAYVTVYYRLAQLHAEKGEYEQAYDYCQMVKAFPRASEKVYRKAMTLLGGIEFAKYAKENPLEFNPKILPKETVNRWDHNSHPSVTADQSTMVLSVRRNQGFLDENIVVCEKSDGLWLPSESISKKINSPKHEGMASISGDGKTLVFASGNRDDSQGGVDLYIAHKVGDTWQEPQNLGTSVNSRFKESEPCLSADGRTIFFSSDRPGGLGSLDIWSTTQLDNGEWSAPQNLGDAINTEREEVTPFIHADGRHLYFASRGHMGMGGYDVFYSTKVGVNWSQPENLGYPINTKDNEGSLVITADYKKGYYEKYVKSRQPGKDHSDVFEFDVPEEIQQKFSCVYAKGVVFDDATKSKLGASIELIDLKTGLVDQKVKSDSINGSYILVLREGGEYALHVRKEGYLFHSLHFDYTVDEDFDPIKLDVYLKPIQSKQAATLSNIFFETGSYSLQDKSTYELDQLINLLKANPSLKVEVSGHTDNVGNYNSNVTLSQNRAKEVVAYLVGKGIEKSRLVSKGYGSKKPIADNSLESGRKRNRRIDITVL